MKRFFAGVLVGLALGIIPAVYASYSVAQSDAAVVTPHRTGDDELRENHAYKWYLNSMLFYLKSVDQKLDILNDTMKAIKDKLHA
jgi:hypothetical protein